MNAPDELKELAQRLRAAIRASDLGEIQRLLDTLDDKELKVQQTSQKTSEMQS